MKPMRQSRSRFRPPAATSGASALACALLCALLLGCGGETVAPTPARPASIKLDADSLWATGDDAVVHATVKDSAGNVLPNVAVDWSSSNDSILTVQRGAIHTLVAGRNAKVLATVPGTSLVASARVRTAPPAGDYDLTATFTDFSFETPAPSPPDCPSSNALYCTHGRKFSGAALSGPLHVGTSGISGTFSGQFCDAWDLTSPGGCTHVANLAAARYDVDLDWFSLGLFQLSGPGAYDPGPPPFHGPHPYVRMELRFAGDSIFGGFIWAQHEDRSPPRHGGTFVARRRR